MPNVVCFGEVLWDVFPDHKKIGGAPLNVALRLNSFGINANIISSIGNDQNGRELLKFITEHNLEATTIQVNNQYQTGCVHVTLDERGSASYEIAYPVAWDKIEVSEKAITLVKASDTFVFGSLACRDKVSKNTLLSLLEHAKFKIFDVNLRPPHYSIALLLELMEKADLIKCNDDELEEICLALDFESEDIQEQIGFLSQKTSTNKMCITRGDQGSVLFTDEEYYTNNGYVINVADTVGAGDSFLATLVFKLLSKVEYQECLDTACAIGALVASKKGANPKLSSQDLKDIMKV